MKKINSFALSVTTTLLIVLISGCAVGPLVNHETARTVGESKNEFTAGYGQAGYLIKWNYGFNKDLDVGLHLETLSVGVRAKYAFINAKEGFSLAAALGTGSSIGGSHYYGDLIGSYLVNSFEPYSTLRIVHVKNDPVELKGQSSGQLVLAIDKTEYNYGQIILGSRFWFTPQWFLSLEASYFLAITSGVKIGDSALINAATGFKF
jgi:hypothetical protein